MTIKYFFPKYRLAEQLSAPGGKPVAEALRAAQAGLAAIGPLCAQATDEILGRIDELWAARGDDPGAGLFDHLYHEASQLIGLPATAGLEALDQAAYSLCDLLGAMNEAGEWDIASISVHLQALRLLRRPEKLATDGGAARILGGLEHIRRKHAANAAAR